MTLKEFSEELNKAREKAGITLQKVAAKTRIDIKFLEAMEDNNFSFLPELYVKAFIKQYAKVVGLDERETVQKYLSAKERKKKSAGEVKDSDSDEVKSEIQEEKEKPVKTFDDNVDVGQKSGAKKKPDPIIIGGAVIGVIVITLLVYFLFLNNGNDIVIEEKPYDEVLRETPKRFVEEKTNDNNINLQQNLEEMTLTISNVDSSDSAWIMVVMDDTTSREFLLLPKISTTVRAYNNFEFTLGNAGVIELLLDNKKLEFEGKRGAVRFFKLDRNGLERIYSPPQVSKE